MEFKSISKHQKAISWIGQKLPYQPNPTSPQNPFFNLLFYAHNPLTFISGYFWSITLKKTIFQPNVYSVNPPHLFNSGQKCQKKLFVPKRESLNIIGFVLLNKNNVSFWSVYFLISIILVGPKGDDLFVTSSQETFWKLPNFIFIFLFHFFFCRSTITAYFLLLRKKSLNLFLAEGRVWRLFLTISFSQL